MNGSVSTAMTEAGVNAYERIQRTKQSQQVIVASVFQAMDAVRRREAIKAPGAAPLYVHQDWPSWRYGPNGERKVFASPDEVPEGWTDSPDFVAAAKEIGAEIVADLPRGRRARG